MTTCINFSNRVAPSPFSDRAHSRPDHVPPTPNLADNSNYALAVEHYYHGLYRFGYKLSRNPNDAADLAQETFRILYAKGTDIREAAKMKGWLFTTLYRLFLRRRRHEVRFPAITLDSAEWDLPSTSQRPGRELDNSAVLAALGRLNDAYRLPLTLFYLEEKSYKEVARTLGLPLGTVMSRLSRGKNLLRQLLQTPSAAEPQGPDMTPDLKWREAATITTFMPEPAEAA